ncbi:MAG TPA: AMP-binding protein, partial [Verrucomicrobiae bacterium]|nr:AMP-binding protein [Verrucomicrobiae bacterium]
MIDGAMQSFPLTLDKFLEHAAKWHPKAEVVTGRENGQVDRAGYADLKARALRVSSVLRGLGVRRGERVATLAWNTQAHVEAWYAIMGMGAVCHTLNLRLTAAQLGDMLVQSQARVLIASADLLLLARSIAEHAPNLERILLIDGDGRAEEQSAAPIVSALEPLIADARGEMIWGEFDETSPSGLCFTSGTTGAPKGVTYTHRSSFLHTLRVLQADVLGLSARDNVLAVVPMFHANAWGLPFAVPAVGAKLVLPGRQTDGAHLAKLIKSESITVGVGIA